MIRLSINAYLILFFILVSVTAETTPPVLRFLLLKDAEFIVVWFCSLFTDEEESFDMISTSLPTVIR